ncbi:hypothetical protein SKAU_G00316050 [Synaphobranchus kaupii]|uniref:Uncharacterized protein n=1 Tax=Synaphobranchus kaupii TaxID=118154 RepID=A0A9Q1IKS7_SYNKA|nr:hypothetical protein SKAU_G00316050 [Synaphobranchus kaupii]
MSGINSCWDRAAGSRRPLRNVPDVGQHRVRGQGAGLAQARTGQGEVKRLSTGQMWEGFDPPSPRRGPGNDSEGEGGQAGCGSGVREICPVWPHPEGLLTKTYMRGYEPGSCLELIRGGQPNWRAAESVVRKACTAARIRPFSRGQTLLIERCHSQLYDVWTYGT